MKEEYTANVKKLVWYLGGRKKISELFEQHFNGIYEPLPENTVRNWVQVNRIPFNRFPQLIHLGAIIGRPVDTHDYLEIREIK